ncbi:histone-lysine N-methyltransferase, H3 lysine-79 specific-like isoform X2 [Centruroides sculpturatus]|uniref:histone-lysine N-methyltransferase, H3 lysine-79 specific-like isoform X2 n=1 Tax=Centruroides sculpturatus TaxID=218467 RepID=UPI000C6EC5B0|nr:histone-lysine N-methyltransferase, H3 lysine-79 specific-like isoform X2 [Centruroides sculpturatus]
MDKRKRFMRSISTFEESPPNSLIHKIADYHEKRQTSQEIRIKSLRSAFSACNSLSNDSVEDEIPQSAEEILKNLGIVKKEPEIPQRFLHDFIERHRIEDVPQLDSRVAKAVEDVKSNYNIEYNHEKSSRLASRRLTRAATLLTLHGDCDSSPKDSSSSDDEEHEIMYEIQTPITKAIEELNKDEDSDSSLYATPQKDSRNCSFSSDSIERPELNRRRSLSCSDFYRLKSSLTSEYATLRQQFKTFRGVSDSNIEISMHSPVKRSCNAWTSADSDEDDILCVILPANNEENVRNEDLRVKNLQESHLRENNLKWIRVVECDKCDLCRIGSSDFNFPSISTQNITSENNRADNTLHSTIEKQCNQYYNTSEKERPINENGIERGVQDLNNQQVSTLMNTEKYNKQDEIMLRKSNSYEENCDKRRNKSLQKSASQELRELQTAIEQVKYRRESASKHLLLLQELLEDDRKNLFTTDSEEMQEEKNDTWKDAVVESIVRENDEFKSRIDEVEHLKIQLEASQEALFVYQNKTENSIEMLEEELNVYKEKLSTSEKRRIEEEERKRSLEVALIEMQKEKQKLQMNYLDLMENSNSKKTEEKLIKSIENELKIKEEENIKLRMEILQIQEELSKDNNHKEIIIEDKDKYIEKLERKIKALSELQLNTGWKDLGRTSSSMSALDEPDYTKEDTKEENNTLERLIQQLEEQQKELDTLRTENFYLKSKVRTVDLNGDLEEPLSSEISSDIGNSDPEITKNNLWKRLKDAEDKAYQEENRADNLNLLLNHKQIEINKLQLTLSSQTKELIQLEKAYYQLRCHLFETRKSSCPALRRSSSKMNNTV